MKLPPIAAHRVTFRSRLKKSGHEPRSKTLGEGQPCGAGRASKTVHRVATGSCRHEIMQTSSCGAEPCKLSCHALETLILSLNLVPMTPTCSPGLGSYVAHSLQASLCAHHCTAFVRAWESQLGRMPCSSSKNRAALCTRVHWAFVPLMSLCSLQSDREKSEGLPVAPFMDRDKVTKATAQIGFIKFVLIPMFETVTKVSDRAGGTPAINIHVHMHTHGPSTASSSVVMVMVAWQLFLLLCPVPPPPVLFKELHV